jgi:hypothetical protein
MMALGIVSSKGGTVLRRKAIRKDDMMVGKSVERAIEPLSKVTRKDDVIKGKSVEETIGQATRKGDRAMPFASPHGRARAWVG